MASCEKGLLPVLLVEDLPDDAFFIERALREGGVRADLVTVSDERPFRAALATSRPAIVLTDHRMPRFSAWQVIDIVLRSAPGVPVVVVTGAMREEDEAEALRRGASAVVRKENLAPLAGIVRRLVAGVLR